MSKDQGLRGGTTKKKGTGGLKPQGRTKKICLAVGDLTAGGAGGRSVRRKKKEKKKTGSRARKKEMARDVGLGK